MTHQLQNRTRALCSSRFINLPSERLKLRDKSIDNEEEHARLMLIQCEEEIIFKYEELTDQASWIAGIKEFSALCR